MMPKPRKKKIILDKIDSAQDLSTKNLSESRLEKPSVSLIAVCHFNHFNSVILLNKGPVPIKR